MISNSRPTVRSIERLFSQALLIGATAAGSLVLGWVPSLQPSSAQWDFGTAAYAQAVSEEEVQRYARAVLEIEPIRQTTYNTIKNAVGYVPSIRCHIPSSLTELDSSIRQYAVDFCNQAITIAEANRLSISRFNEITAAHESDPALAERIRQALLQLQ